MRPEVSGRGGGHPESKTSANWGLLTPELIQKIASYVHNNDVVENLKLVNKETAAALKGHNVLQLAREAEPWPRDRLPPRAQTPWPCRSFVEHCRRVGAWRRLSLYQRRRLVCLAASCGDPASLEAAVSHCGCSLGDSALDSAAAVGDVSACEALLDAGSDWGDRAVELAAEGGHLPVLQLLLRRGMPVNMLCGTPYVLAAACRGGHAHVVAWIETRKGCGFLTAEELQSGGGGGGSLRAQRQYEDRLGDEAWRLAVMAAAAAEQGHAELFQGIACRLEQTRQMSSWAEGLLAAVASGCSLELLQQCYSRWVGEGREQLSLPDWVPGQDGPELCDTKQRLLARAGGSATPDALAKHDWLLQQWPAARAALLQQPPMPLVYGYVICSPEVRTEGGSWTRRLQELAARGCAFSVRDALCAVKAGDVEALSHLLASCTSDETECLLTKAAECGRLTVLQHLLQPRRKLSQALMQAAVNYAADANTGVGAGADALLRWCCDDAVDEDAVAAAADNEDSRPQFWQLPAFNKVLSSGAVGLEALQALRRRCSISSADLDLKELAKGGCEEQMEWGAAVLAEAGKPLPTLSPQMVWFISYAHGNHAGLDWLRGRGLVRRLPAPSWVANQDMCGEGYFDGLRYWLHATAAAVVQKSQQQQQQQPAAAAAAAAGAAAGSSSHGAGGAAALAAAARRLPNSFRKRVMSELSRPRGEMLALPRPQLEWIARLFEGPATAQQQQQEAEDKEEAKQTLVPVRRAAAAKALRAVRDRGASKRAGGSRGGGSKVARFKNKGKGAAGKKK